ncbi:MAG: transcriptional regulator [Methanopyri archaeon]|nr:transcriptional regulator [Methanopyri archaeon]|tara:strand:+ start:317 stop:646 length:330 start_codon:yes stop_codon:yes gene_type:complete
MPLSEPSEGETPPIMDIDRVIHAPARLLILSLLYVVESGDYVFLMRQTGLTWGNLSTHMTKLEKAGYVEVVKEFVDRKPHTMAKLTPDGRRAFDEYRTSMKRVLEGVPG